MAAYSDGGGRARVAALRALSRLSLRSRQRSRQPGGRGSVRHIAQPDEGAHLLARQNCTVGTAG